MCDHLLFDFGTGTPAPNAYNALEQYGNMSSWEKAPSYTVRERYRTSNNPVSNNPGPGAYNADYRNVVSSPNAYSLRGRFHATSSTTPGPGAYNNQDHRSIIGNAAPTYTLHSKHAVGSDTNPGPGQYGVLHDTPYFGKKDITVPYTFPKVEENKLFAGNSTTGAVGPGQYRNEEFAYLKNKAPVYTLHDRTGKGFNEIAANQNVPGPGSYNCIAGNIDTKCHQGQGWSFGQRGRRGYIRDRVPHQ